MNDSYLFNLRRKANNTELMPSESKPSMSTKLTNRSSGINQQTNNNYDTNTFSPIKV